MVRLLKSQMHSRRLPSFLRMNNIEAPAGHMEGCKIAVIYQVDKMIVDANVLRQFGNQVRRKPVRKIQILGKDICRGLFGNQAGYLRLSQRVDVEWGGAGRRIRTDWPDMNYIGLMLRVKRYSCKLWGLWVGCILSGEELGNASELTDSTWTT